MSNNKTYLVYRPYCNPRQVVIIATSKKDAIKQSHKNFGFADDTSAKLYTRRGIVL